MANTTIGQLTLVTSAAAGDFIEIETVGGLSRRITKANFIGAIISGGGTLALGANTLTVSGNSNINGNISGGGTLALGGFTLTVPATGTAALLALAQTFSALKTFSAGINLGQNNLNIFEIGTWPCVIGSVGGAVTQNPANSTGRYFRLGNSAVSGESMVFFTVSIGLSSISGGSGDATFSLPFPAVADFSQGNILLHGVDVAGTPISITFEVNAGSSYGRVRLSYDNAPATSLPITGISGTATIRITGWYRT